MSIFGQVWVFSAVAFVLGALLAWLFLVKPAQKRIRELERRLAAAESAPVPAPVNAPAPAPETRTLAPPAEREAEEPVAPMPSTRHFEPAESEPEAAEMTQHIAPVTDWPERDSLQEYRSRQPKQDERQPAEDDFHLADQPWDLEPQEQAGVSSVLDGGRDTGQGRHGQPEEQPADHSEPEPYEEQPAGRHSEREPEPHHEPEPYREPERYEEPEAYREPEPEPQPEPEPRPAPRKAPSLFEPVPFDLEDEQPEPERREPEAPPTYAFGEPGATPDAEDAVEQTQVLPKRQPRKSPLGGFEPPRPIQPSMRPVERREPESDGGMHSGSLFEPAVAPGGAAPPARESTPDSELPPGPFGPGSAMPRPGGGRPSEEFAVKASVTALRYCTEDSAQFPRMVAEVWFRTPADAERVGFRPLS
ncbi:hypothetical protein DI005_10690 [Prauserella sp. PE36]|uniref:Uncharacterized protein n=1 Tax=Prauserella endophytica TaxID=1592324 RepID=A0ABY2SD05_9PSEU|nr:MULTISPECIES: LapA family protein [Prauserella]RBM21283.1 hypothetical protein DI005_10690 [Prauserella sp. PE36]TKG73690.1 hypothetical protein FCN18_03840 [Prauserella endophytica]